MSITIWNRIEPRTREGRKLRGKDDKTPDPLRRGLQAQIRDPLWFLTRQWQTGEFFGEDAGYPVQAQLTVETHPISSIRVPIAAAPTALAQDGPPLEILAEQMPLLLGLRGSVQLGLRFEAMLLGAQPAVPDAASRLTEFRAAYPIAAAASQDDIEDHSADRYRLLSAGRVTDGIALVVDASASGGALPAKLQLVGMTAAHWQDVAGVVAAFEQYWRSLYSEPSSAADAWSPEQLRYHFGVDVATLGASLDAPEFEGGHLEWYDFSFGTPMTGQRPPAPAAIERTFIPHPVSFRGMPKARWWSLDDGATDFGGLDVQHTDLARMLLAEFALLYSDDWFELPVRVALGSLARVTLLLVTDTFGVRTLIRPTSQQISPGERSWSMFAIDGIASLADALFLPPTSGDAHDGPTLEEVTFFRDEMASMGWAVERTLQGPLDSPVAGYESYLKRLQDHPLPPPPNLVPGGAEIEYVLGTTVPDNWIPLVPVSGGPRTFLFRRGLMQRPTAAGVLEDVHARGRILEPERRPFYIAEEAIPRAGARALRRFRRTRWLGGRTYVWVGRYVSIGRGEGSSGLAFDVVEQRKAP